MCVYLDLYGQAGLAKSPISRPQPTSSANLNFSFLGVREMRPVSSERVCQNSESAIVRKKAAQKLSKLDTFLQLFAPFLQRCS